MNVLRRVLWGIGAMMWPAVAACALAGIGYAADTSHASTSHRPGLGVVWVWYVSAAILGGVVLGLAKPLLVSPLGRGVTGFLVAIPVAAVILFRSPFGDSVPFDTVGIGSALALAAVVGPGMAAYVTLQNRQRKKQDRAPDA